MGLFGTIMEKIFHHGAARAPAAHPAPAPGAVPAAAPPPQAAQPAPPAAAQAQTAPQTPVDVEAVLKEIATEQGGGGNWRTSIVDLLKLLDLDSSLAARKELADELGVHAGADGSAEENVALHRAVMRKLAENGGTVPANLRD